MKITKTTVLLEKPPLGQTSDDQVKVYAITGNGQSGTITYGNGFKVEGTGFCGSEKGWYLAQALLYPDATKPRIICSLESMDETEIGLFCSEDQKPDVGEYPNARLCLGFTYATPSGEFVEETLELPVRLVVE